MLEFLASKIGLVMVLGVLGFAWSKGGAGDRAGATAVTIAWIAALALQSVTPREGQAIVLTMADGLLAVAMLVIAIRYSTLWLGVAMVLQGAVLAIHSIALGGGLGKRDYLVDLNIASLGMLIAIVLATIASWMSRIRARRKKAGAAPPSGIAATPA